MACHPILREARLVDGFVFSSGISLLGNRYKLGADNLKTTGYQFLNDPGLKQAFMEEHNSAASGIGFITQSPMNSSNDRLSLTWVYSSSSLKLNSCCNKYQHLEKEKRDDPFPTDIALALMGISLFQQRPKTIPRNRLGDGRQYRLLVAMLLDPLFFIATFTLFIQAL